MKVSDHRLALGFAAGAFVSFTPFVGFHFLLAATLALLLRGNIVASAVGTIVGNPFTFPVIWLGTYNIGALLLGLTPRESVSMATESLSTLWGDGPVGLISSIWANFEPVFLPMCVGAIPLGIACAAASYIFVLAGVRSIRYGQSTARYRTS